VDPQDRRHPLDEAALIEPLSVVHHAVTRSGAKAGDIALIGGAAPIGLLTAAVPLVLKEIDLRGTIDLKPFITGRIALDELITQGFDTLIHRNDTAVKILVHP
jgi:threonine dehydrogenase-like Zn-dependent dehydrogenase